MHNTKDMKYNIDFLDILALIFITLKLTHVIDWSWWWVLSPVLVKLGVVLIGLFIALIAIIIHLVISRRW